MATTTAVALQRQLARPAVRGPKYVAPTQPVVPRPVFPGSTPNINPIAGLGPSAPVQPQVQAQVPAPAPVQQPLAPQPAAIRPSQRFQGAAAPVATGADGVDPQFLEILKQRIMGEGLGPSFDDIIRNVYEPQASIMDRIFGDAKSQSIEDLVGRGVLSSGESQRAMTDLDSRLANEKAALLGGLGLEHEANRQNALSASLGQFGQLEGQRLASRTSITTANIGARAQVQASSIAAGATRDAAQISASAAMQIAQGNNATAKELATARMTSEGFDYNEYLTNPEYRVSWHSYWDDYRNSVLNSIDAGALGQVGMPGQV